MSFILLTENTFCASYLVDKWFRVFGDVPTALNIGIRAEPQQARLLVRRDTFHHQQKGRKLLDKAAERELLDLYPNISETDLALIRTFGIPGRPAACDSVVYLGRDINGPESFGWLSSITQGRRPVHVFVSLCRLLAYWWMTKANGRIYNAHSAVLPYARGMFAIEQVAATGDIDHFRNAAGATVHVVDEGVDTGPIVRRDRLVDPFGATSIWECKAR